MDAVVMRALAKDPADRYQTADEFIADLSAARDAPPEAAVFAPRRETVIEEELPPERRRWWLWLLGLLALVAIAVALFLLLSPAKRSVPDVVGQRSATASQILQNRGFEVNIETVVNADVPRDTVATQNPQPHTTAREGTTVTIIVSSGPGEAAVPQVVGLPADQAEQALRKAGFTPDVKRTYSADVASGRVISASPQEGTTADKGTTVRLTVSRGAQPVSVPGVVGKDADEARGLLEGAGLKVSTTDDTTSTKDPNTVTAQDPKAGTEVKPGSTVTLKVVKPADVPDVSGQSESDATNALRQAGFQVRVRHTTTDNASEVGKVVDQNPGAGEQRKRGSTVTIEIGRASSTVTPTPTPTDTATPSPTPTDTAAP
jgi:serine/threonine-protein kinase